MVNRYDDVTFSLVVTNTGDAPVHDVAVGDALPAGDFSYVAGSTNAFGPEARRPPIPRSRPAPSSTGLRTPRWRRESSSRSRSRCTWAWSSWPATPTAPRRRGLDGGGVAVTPPTGTADITVVKPGTTGPAVAITKTLAKGQPGTVGLGDPVRYTIVVTNSGDTSLVTVPLTDTFDRSALQFVSASPAPQAKAPGTLGWSD